MTEFFTARFETIKDFFVTQKLPVNFWRSLFSWDYWTDSALQAKSPYFTSAIGLVVITIVVLLVWRARLKKRQVQTPIYDRPLQQLLNIIFFVSIMAASYWFFRSQEINYLSRRLVILATLLITLIWIGWVWFDLKKRLPGERRRYLEKERFFRYLPKKRKK